MYTCISCKEHSCRKEDSDKVPNNCPTHEVDMQNEIKGKYSLPENYNIAHSAALVEADGYCKKTRLEEIIDFANNCDYKKLGVAFCMGLSSEAEILLSVLKHNGFHVESVICKNGNIPKEFLGLTEQEKINPGRFETMCNPIGQAEFLNKEKTELNIILGLCVGHDALFSKYSLAPVTTFAVKDRVLAHNPIAVLYMAEGYYKKKLFK
jgi:uncharacterized metal-binding protein